MTEGDNQPAGDPVSPGSTPPTGPAGNGWADKATSHVTDGGRLHVPKAYRDDLGIEIGDVIDVRVLIDGSTVYMPERIVKTQGRILIPSDQREIHDIEDGDRLGVEVRVRPREAGDEG